MEGKNEGLIAVLALLGVGGIYYYMKKQSASALTAQQAADQSATNTAVSAAQTAQAAQDAQTQAQNAYNAQTATATATAPYGYDANGNPLTQAQATAMAAPGYNSIPYNYLVQYQPSNLATWNVMDTTSLGTMYQYYYTLQQGGTANSALLPLYNAAKSVALEYGIAGIDNPTLDNFVTITNATYSSPAAQVPTGKISPAFTTVPAASVNVTSAYASRVVNGKLALSLTGPQMDAMAGVTFQQGMVDTLTISYTLGSSSTVLTKTFSRPATGSVSITLP